MPALDANLHGVGISLVGPTIEMGGHKYIILGITHLIKWVAATSSASAIQLLLPPDWDILLIDMEFLRPLLNSQLVLVAIRISLCPTIPLQMGM
ncbi:hypothetical protein DSO57_1017792 [Entomophthora muscae]|uniref:Uncharacterized protein n=1 Tax=Entomophthora muscae TaxID=34485 RepID=A0ACC2RVS1_9FUNG|nr:hypothetical protein DSO57_1017792 [Entomophthora muscae]